MSHLLRQVNEVWSQDKEKPSYLSAAGPCLSYFSFGAFWLERPLDVVQQHVLAGLMNPEGAEAEVTFRRREIRDRQLDPRIRCKFGHIHGIPLDEVAGDERRRLVAKVQEEGGGRVRGNDDAPDELRRGRGAAGGAGVDVEAAGGSAGAGVGDRDGHLLVQGDARGRSRRRGGALTDPVGGGRVAALVPGGQGAPRGRRGRDEPRGRGD